MSRLPVFSGTALGTYVDIFTVCHVAQKMPIGMADRQISLPLQVSGALDQEKSGGNQSRRRSSPRDNELFGNSAAPLGSTRPDPQGGEALSARPTPKACLPKLSYHDGFRTSEESSCL